MTTPLDGTVRQLVLDGQSVVVEYLRQVGFDVKVHEAPLGDGETAVIFAIVGAKLDGNGRLIDAGSDLVLLNMEPHGNIL